jgi:DNA-binding FadR family transcriptional regulator
MRKSLPETIAEGLLESILDGTHAPGTTLPSEATLAERFDVNRLTVREALKSLASTNVITVRHGKSSVVNPVERWSPLDTRLLQARGRAAGDSASIGRQLLEARRAVEVAIAELAASRRSEGHLRTLDAELGRMRAAHDSQDVDAFVEADLAFHNALFDAADNVFLVALFEPLAAVLRKIRQDTSSVPQIREHAIQWHATVLAGVAAGDPAAARAAMQGHLRQTEDDSLRYLREPSADSAQPA